MYTITQTCGTGRINKRFDMLATLETIITINNKHEGLINNQDIDAVLND